MKDCRFCEVDELKTRTLEESEGVRIVFSNPRLMKGHLLAIPKRHIEQPWELTTNELNELFQHIHRLQKKLSETLGTGCDMRQNYRPFLKEGRLKVDHLHFHLMPRTFQDELYEKSMIHEAAVFTDLPDGEVEQISAILKTENS